ncbi:hypothetical protein TWF694_002721 [Orbilia ellipsospora]|uniref:Uncharacterized protein n=1 Tax=Orbilia ellipsospora TaxID=2528407 RepID=A0AAV9X420_9PEZI
MHLKTTAAVVILALTPEIAGHAIPYNIIGDADISVSSYILGIHTSTPRTGTTQLPFQRDIAVFKNPVVPATKWSKWWKKPRTYWANGCGANIWDQNIYYSTAAATKKQYAKATAAQKNYWYYQMPAKKMIDWKGITTTYAQTNRIIKVSPGGWIRMMVHQLNGDGAGPYKCKISSTGEPSGWNAGWIQPTGANNVPGTAKSYSNRVAGTLQDFPLTVDIPANLKCSGSYAGMNNICMMRCENYAINGPFGGCVPFQLVTQTAPAPPPPAATGDNIGDTPQADSYTISPAQASAIAQNATSTTDNDANPSINPTVDPSAEGYKRKLLRFMARDAQPSKEEELVKRELETAQEELVKREAEAHEEELVKVEYEEAMKAKRATADDEALAVALGGEDTPPALIAAAKKQLAAIPSAQKAKLNAKIAAGKKSNAANAGNTGNN